MPFSFKFSLIVVPIIGVKLDRFKQMTKYFSPTTNATFYEDLDTGRLIIVLDNSGTNKIKLFQSDRLIRYLKKKEF